MLRAWAVRVHARPPTPTQPSPLSASSTPSVSPKPNPDRFAMASSIRIAVVGDVHDDWDLQEDSKALEHLQPDLVLFTGDFGNENVELVRSIASLNMPKAAILGNHDCWNTYQFSQKKADRLQPQLECLGEQHVGYNHLDFPVLKVSVVGGRPFSCGGDKLFRPRLLSARYGVNDMEASAKRIYEAALETPEGHSIIILAHNGPSGLGSKMNDICGRDWVYGGGDHGDPDLAQAISNLKRSAQFPIPLVVFGHMHKQLAYGGLRKMIVARSDGTIYLNGAIVPRVKYNPNQGNSSRSIGRDQNEPQIPDSENGTLRAFTVVDILGGTVKKISELWVLVAADTTVVEAENILYSNP